MTIVGGAGGVGASTAFNLALMRGPHEVVIVDSRPEMITSHAMDLEQVLEQSPGCSVRGGDAGDLADADIVVLISATPLTVDTPRVEYLGKNALIADAFADALPAGWGGVLVVVTNPVDPLVTRLQQRTGLDRRRILGYTLNDSLRLRTGLAKALGAPPGSVEAWVIGEHGDLSVPLYGASRSTGSPSSRRPSSRRSPRSTGAPGTRATSRSTRAARRPGRPASASRAWSPRSTATASSGPPRSCSRASTASTASPWRCP